MEVENQEATAVYERSDRGLDYGRGTKDRTGRIEELLRKYN